MTYYQQSMLNSNISLVRRYSCTQSLGLGLENFPTLTSVIPFSEREFNYSMLPFDTLYLPSDFNKQESLTLFAKQANSKSFFFSALTKHNRNKISGFYLEIMLFGLFHTAKRTRMYKLPFHLKLNQSHNVSCYELPFSSVRTRIYKRRIVFFSLNKTHLVSIVNSLVTRRPADSYHGHGIGVKGRSYSLLEGKVRQR